MKTQEPDSFLDQRLQSNNLGAVEEETVKFLINAWHTNNVDVTIRVTRRTREE